MKEYLVELKSISKFFNGVKALDGVDFGVGYNEIIGLVGDNGAGKSTLIKVLTGVHRPDKGEIYYRGKKIEKYSVSKARELGIEAVYQEKALVEQQTISRNVFIGRELVDRYGFLQIKRQETETEGLLREIGFTTSKSLGDAVVRTLSGGEKEGVAIARALYFEADLIVLDEPTMALSISEVGKVLNFVREIKNKGKSCIFITHNIYHVYPVSDRFVILDRGKVAGESRKDAISLDALVDKLREVAVAGKV